MINISNTAYLTSDNDFNNKNPIVCFSSVLRPQDFIAATVDPLRPPRNMWSPDTGQSWIGIDAVGSPAASTSQTITLLNPAAVAVDYVAIARHNLKGFGLKIERSFDGTTFAQIFNNSNLPDDGPIVAYFNPVAATHVKLTITKSVLGTPAYVPAPVIAHIKMGSALVLQRRVFAGVKPPIFAEYDRVNNVSENGQYLGQVLNAKFKKGSISQQNNAPSFVRNNLVPFFNHLNGQAQYPDSATTSFFYAWRPTSYIDDVVYAWPSNIEYPVITGGDGLGGRMSWSVDWEAIA